MKVAGCKSDESNQFSQPEIWKPRPGSINSHRRLHLASEQKDASALIKALEEEAGVEV